VVPHHLRTRSRLPRRLRHRDQVLFALAARVGHQITIARNGSKQGFEPGIVAAAKPPTKPLARGAASVTKMTGSRRVPRHRASEDDGQTMRLPDLRDKKSA
jgi:hypothetical protein